MENWVKIKNDITKEGKKGERSLGILSLGLVYLPADQKP